MSTVYVTVVNRADLQRHTKGKMSLERIEKIVFFVSTIIVLCLVTASEISAEDCTRENINDEAHRRE